MDTIRRPIALFFVALLSVFAAGVGGVAYASHQFPDVPDQGFHNQIGAIVDAGCATGFNDGTFRPQSGTTRGQFAFWTHNCGGRIAFANGINTNTAVADDDVNDGFRGPETTLLTDQITIGGSGKQFALITATVLFEAFDVASSYCPVNHACRPVLSISIVGHLTVGQEGRLVGDYDGGAVTAQGVARLAPGTYTVTVSAAATGVAPGFPINAKDPLLTVVTAPFGPTGTDDF